MTFRAFAHNPLNFFTFSIASTALHLHLSIPPATHRGWNRRSRTWLSKTLRSMDLFSSWEETSTHNPPCGDDKRRNTWARIDWRICFELQFWNHQHPLSRCTFEKPAGHQSWMDLTLGSNNWLAMLQCGNYQDGQLISQTTTWPVL